MTPSRFCLAAGIVFLAAVSLLAQTTTGTLTGVVTQAGIPLPGVSVTISSPNLQSTRRDMTNQAGAYNFGALPPGEYTVRFDLEGLRTAMRRVHVGVAQDARADAALSVLALEEVITVRAAAPAVAETTEVQTNFQQQLIEDLPVARSITGITGLAPGVVAGVNGFQISGGMSFDNLYTVNGAVIQENLRGQPHNLFIEDAIQETTVQTAGVSAEFGNFTGGVVNAVTRSGTNRYSGSLRDSMTNPRWTARSPDIFVNAGGVPTRTSAGANLDQLNQVWEATLGGRIVRDRLWFFLAGRQSENESERFLSNSTIPYVAVTTDERQEAKVTGAITSRHSIVASYMNTPLEQVNNCQFGCYDLEAVDPFIRFPNNFVSAFYSGVITNNFLLEARYAEVNFEFDSLGGDDAGLATGTPINLTSPGFNTYANAPPFSGIETTDVRDNESIGLKGTYFFGSRAFGNHSITAGVDRFHETRRANNHQSATGFRIVSRTFAPQRAGGQTLVSLMPAIGSVVRDFAWWFPIQLQSQGSDLTTDALWVNDKWDLGSRFSSNLGVRFDRNDSSDSQGRKVADDRKISPRLGVAYDMLANGRLRLIASYGTYVGRLAESVAGITSAAGTPSAFAFAYEGPELRDLPTAEVARRFFEWFNANGATNRPTIAAIIPGFTTRLQGTLQSPNAAEWTVGASTQFGRGFIRADFIHRNWDDFYAAVTNRSTGTVTSPTGARNDLLVITNSNDLDRTYDAVELQGQWHVARHLDIGGNYTWAETRGNTSAEDVNGGPFATITKQYYPEYRDFSWNNPTGFLPTDQTHKLRAWATLGFDTHLGNFNVSVLERFDSGSPYSLTGSIDIRQSANFYGPGQPGGVPNPGYVTVPTGVTYYFSDRGQFRFDDLTATDLALNYKTNRAWLAGVSLFVQGEVLNVFNEDAATAVNASVLTHLQDPSLRRFNPLAGDVPLEGVHWRKGPLFGLPTAATSGQAAGSFQLPRTYRVSLGVKF
ncbi:MAG TPA: TonB-dependent receptor [Thermoanaerobaculia bacterium]|nr:TonB-dependent receptor [Thermoanaerobaculia bacterium]